MHTHPKWKYHATEAAQVVDDEKIEEALGGGWFDTPAEAAERAQAEESRRTADDGADDKITEEERLELLELARSMGLKPHHRLAADKLLSLIEEERARLKATE